MNKLPKRTRNSLQKEAIQWDAAISGESSEEVQELLNNAEPFRVPRPARQPVSLRMDPRLVRRTGRIALILDDFGYQDRELVSGFCALTQRVTFSVLPNERHSVWTAQQATSNGHGVMVHLPMEPLDFPERDPGPCAIFADYGEARIQTLTRQGLTAVPGARGINNHMGSRVTEDLQATLAVLKEVGRHRFFFVDSMTSLRSVAYTLAQELGVPSGRNVMFLDRRERTADVVGALHKLAIRARQEGTVIAIGHAKKNTLAALQDVLPELEAEGFEFIKAEDAVQ